MSLKRDRELLFMHLWHQCIIDTCTPDMLEVFDNACGTHLRTHQHKHEWQAFYEFIRDDIWPKWIDTIITKDNAKN